MQIWAESGKSALPICNYSQILYQFLTFTQNLKRSPNKPCNSGSFIRQYMQFLSHSRRSHSRRGKNSILLLFLKYKI